MSLILSLIHNRHYHQFLLITNKPTLNQAITYIITSGRILYENRRIARFIALVYYLVVS